MVWLSKLTQRMLSRKDNIQQVVVIQADAVYLSSLQRPESKPEIYPISHSNWESALLDAFSGKAIKGNTRIVLGAALYQSYQLERPQLPKDEWPVALPFLLKDLVADKVSDIVADATLLPNGQTIQAYVINKRILQSLLEACESNGIELHSVIPEEEVWGSTAAEDKHSFLLLRRNSADSYKLSAYVDGVSVFNRSLRGIAAPITGTHGNDAMYDSLALDIQRSADYLAANLPQSSFSQLLVACDEDNTTELITKLSEIVNPKIEPLTDSSLPCGIILCNATSKLQVGSVNLYPHHLHPKQELVTLNKMVAVWAITALVIGGLAHFEQQQAQALNAELVGIDSQLALLSNERSRLQQRLASHAPTTSKLDAAKRIQADIDAKLSSLDAVGKFDESQKLGFAGIMEALSRQARNDISLQHIYINNMSINLTGVASTPAAVPSWVNQFKQELTLVGRTFESLNIGRNDKNVVTFQLKTKAGAK